MHQGSFTEAVLPFVTTQGFKWAKSTLITTHSKWTISRVVVYRNVHNSDSVSGIFVDWIQRRVIVFHPPLFCRIYLAAMHYNENAGRAQATTALGAARYSLSYPRSKQDAGGYTICKKLVNSTFCKSDNSYHSSQKSYISERM